MSKFLKIFFLSIIFIFTFQASGAVFSAWDDTKIAGQILSSSEWNTMVNAVKSWIRENNTETGSNVYLGTTGNVGIGSSNPQSKLVIKGSTNDSSASALNVADNSANSLLFIRNDGNVGIGTVNPSANLDIGGALKISGWQGVNASNNSTWIDNNNSYTRFFNFGDTTNRGGLIIYSGLGDGSNSIAPIQITYGTGDILLVQDGGNVGIGTTDSGFYKLNVAGNTNITGTLNVSSTVTLANNQIDSNEVNFNYAGSSSKGGVATTTVALNANGADCPAGQYARGVNEFGVAEYCTADQVLTEGTVEGYISNDVSTNYIPYDNGTKLVDSNIVYNGGNVGIGTIDPGSYKLNVAGNTNITGTLNVTSSITAPIFNGSLNGNAMTATGLIANGANCSAGQYARGVNEYGVAEDCVADQVLTEGTVEGYIANDVNTNYIPYDNGTKLVDSNIVYNGGNVGIGTIDPGSYKLNVAGNTKIGGSITFGGGEGILNSGAGDSITILTKTNTPNPNITIGYGNGAGALDSSKEYVLLNGGIGLKGNTNITGTLNVTSSVTSATFNGSLNGNALTATSAGSITCTNNCVGDAQLIDSPTFGVQELRLNSSTPYLDFSNDGAIDYDGRILLVSDDAMTIDGVNLTVNGSIYAQAFYYTSDKRLKENIGIIPSALEKVNQLNGVSFTWKKDGRKDMGFIAQDLEKVLPELVNTDSNGFKSVEYGNVNAVLVEAVKELNKKVEKLEGEIKELQTRK